MYIGVDLEELRKRGQSLKVARVLGVSEHEAIGMLTDAWGETQRRKMVTCTPDAFVAATSIRFDDARKVFDAMVAAELISPAPDAGVDHWLIHGNEKHVRKIEAYKSSASAGGKASAAKRAPSLKRSAPNRSTDGHTDRSSGRSSDGQATAQPIVERRCAERSSSISVFQYSDHDLGTSDPDLSPATSSEDLPRSPPEQKTLGAGGAQVTLFEGHESLGAGELTRALDFSSPEGPNAEHSRTHRLRLAYERLWADKFGRPYQGWRGKHAKHAARIAATEASFAEAMQLLELFFEWQHPQVAHSYSFCDGNWSFSSQLDALRARLDNPNHDRAVGAVGAAQRQVSNQDAEELRYESEMREHRARWKSEADGVNKRLDGMTSVAAVIGGAK